MAKEPWPMPSSYPARLPFVGSDVSQLKVDYALTLCFDDGSQIRLECPFTFVTRDGDCLVVDPSAKPSELSPVLAIIHTQADSADFDESGAAELRFSTGEVLYLTPHAQFESWAYNGPSAELVVVMPGGGIAFWSAPTNSRRVQAAVGKLDQ